MTRLSDPLLQAALDGAYKLGIVDAEQAATRALLKCPAEIDPETRSDLIEAVCRAIDARGIEHLGEKRFAQVTERTRSSPRDNRGDPITQ